MIKTVLKDCFKKTERWIRIKFKFKTELSVTKKFVLSCFLETPSDKFKKLDISGKTDNKRPKHQITKMETLYLSPGTSSCETGGKEPEKCNKVTLTDNNRLKNRICIRITPNKLAKGANTAQKPAKPAGNNADVNVNKKLRVTNLPKPAKTCKTIEVTKNGIFKHKMAKNRNSPEITLLWMKSVRNEKCSCQKFLEKYGKKSMPVKNKKRKMTSTLTKIARYTAKLLEDGDVSDEELAQIETKPETVMEISMDSLDTISENELDGKINFTQISEGNLKYFMGHHVNDWLKHSPKPPARECMENKLEYKPRAISFLQMTSLNLNQYLEEKNINLNSKIHYKMPQRVYELKKYQNSALILNKTRVSKIIEKGFKYKSHELKPNKKIKITFTENILNANTDEETEAIETDGEPDYPEAELTREEFDRQERRLWERKFRGRPPYPGLPTPEEIEFWAEWAEKNEKDHETETETEAENYTTAAKPDPNPEADQGEESSTTSTRPAALPKGPGRCKEGNFCDNLMDHSCTYDTSSTVTMESAKSIEFRGTCRTGEERQKPPAPLVDFTINDLELQVDGPVDKEDAPSIIWTDISVQSTMASILSTEPSVQSTQASVCSTVPSIMIVEEIDLRFNCQCGTRMGPEEREATQEFAARNPAPYVCYNCRWASVGL